jgi:hypothetical protein
MLSFRPFFQGKIKWKGSFCDGRRKTYPSEGFILRQPSQNLPLQRVHFATAVANPTPPMQLLPHTQRKLTCIDLVPISGSFAASHQIVGITHKANWHATKPTLSIAVVNLTTPTELESVCQSACTVYRRANLPSSVTVL